MADNKRVLIRFGVVLGCLLVAAASFLLFVYVYSSAGPPIDKNRVKAVGILRHDDTNYLFNCLGGVIESAELVPASDGRSLPGVVWRVQLVEPTAGEAFLPIGPELDGYEVDGAGGIEDGDSLAISSIRTSAGSAGPYRLHLGPVELSNGEAVLGDGEVLGISELGDRFPACPLPEAL